jgi:hypothetical protein
MHRPRVSRSHHIFDGVLDVDQTTPQAFMSLCMRGRALRSRAEWWPPVTTKGLLDLPMAVS